MPQCLWRKVTNMIVAFFIGLALGALSLGLVAYPFFRRRGVPLDYTDPILELQRRRQAIYQEVRLLENDYALGNVPPAEHQERLQGYRLDAAKLLYQEERLIALGQLLEREILQARKAAQPAGPAALCPDCGHAVESAARQCPVCGSLITEAPPIPKS